LGDPILAVGLSIQEEQSIAKSERSTVMHKMLGRIGALVFFGAGFLLRKKENLGD
jgi:hypothetical protein